MRVSCIIDEVELTNDDGRPVGGIKATCTRCEHKTRSFGTSDRSIARCLVLMKEECPRSEKNFYVEAK